MVSKSLRSLKLPRTATGKPDVVCQEILAPLFEAAVETILVCIDPKPEHLARMTWGLAPIVREGSKLTLLAVVTDPVTAEMNPDTLRINWQESLKTHTTAQRETTQKLDAADLRIAELDQVLDSQTRRLNAVEGERADALNKNADLAKENAQLRRSAWWSKLTT